MTTSQFNVFVGCYGENEQESLHWLRFDSEQGKLETVSSFSGIENPSFIALNSVENRLYAVSEVEAGEVVSFEIDYPTKSLRELNRRSVHGWAPCFTEVDKDDQYLFTVNYGEGNITVHPLDTSGFIESACDIHDFKEKAVDLGVASHPHTIRNIPNTNKYLVTDLGLDRLFLYELDRSQSKLLLINEIEMTKGSGPRHIAFHPKLRKVYVVNELDSTVTVCTYNEKATSLEILQTLSTLPDEFEGKSYCADIHIDASGTYLYASNRGHHSITTFKIGKDGLLEAMTQTSSAGEWPRNFAIIPGDQYMLVANEHTNNIVVMRMRENGKLHVTGEIATVNKPVCLKVIKIED
ncbi:lactonase family protein [Bacillus niameyensis]|uniref:lactonase family protein n=1 Tax=Bacillus niameyensis TaxID=1522308 RepID=UPI0007864B22|nr:lactonase family protein [Bacillus niameyensis]